MARGGDDEMLRVRATAELLEHHNNLVADILQASGLQMDQARESLGRPIEAFARYVSVLPATRHEFYSRPEGLLLLGLECALLAARKAQVWEFSGFGHIERRRIEAPRWRVACVLGGLLYDIHRVVSEWIVRGGDECWLPLREPLAAFASRQPAGIIRLQSRKCDPGGGCGSLAWNLPLAHRVVDDRTLSYLYEGDPEIVSQLYSTLSGEAEHQAGNVIRPLVVDARRRLIARQDDKRAPRDSQKESAASAPASVDTPGSSAVDKPPNANQAPNKYTEPADARSEPNLNSLDYSTQLLVKEISKVLARPRGSKGHIQLQSDGRLSVRGDWIRALGFDVKQVASRLAHSGWLDRAEGATAHEALDVLVFNEKTSNLLIGPRPPADLLGTVTGGQRSPK